MLGGEMIMDLTQASPSPVRAAPPKLPRRSPRCGGGVVTFDATSPQQQGGRRSKRASAGQRTRHPDEGYGISIEDEEDGAVALGSPEKKMKTAGGAKRQQQGKAASSSSSFAAAMEVVDISDDDDEEEQEAAAEAPAASTGTGGAAAARAGLLFMDEGGQDGYQDSDDEDGLIGMDIARVVACAAAKAASKRAAASSSSSAAGGAFGYASDSASSSASASPPPQQKRKADKAPKKTAEEKEREKAERARQKEQAKEDKARAREDAKRQKEAEKEAKKLDKARQVAEHKVLQGQFKREEVTVVLELGLAITDTGQEIMRMVDEGHFKRDALPGPPSQPLSRYHPGLVRWTRSPHDYEPSRNEAPWLEELDFALVVWDGESFCRALAEDAAQGRQHHGGGGGGFMGLGGSESAMRDYAVLEQKVDAIRHSPGMRPSTRLTLVLEGVNEAIAVLAQRGASGVLSGAPFSSVETADLEDALVWLLLHKGVESKVTSTSEETAVYVAELTRSLAETPYRDTPMEFNSSYNKSKTPLPHDLTVQAADDDDRLARTAWLHQLETIPGIGTAKAIAIMRHHPTLRSLLRVYETPRLSQENKQDYLADKMGADNRLYRAFSRKIYCILTSQNPEQLLDD